MVDGVHFGDHLCVVALGITIDGTKVPLDQPPEHCLWTAPEDH
jgi:hypothetical protein